MTDAIASHVTQVASTPLGNADVEGVRLLLLDNFIVSLWGATRPWTRQIVAWTRRFAGTGDSPVLGGDWCADPSVAALVHGTAAHSCELDDTHDETLSHPGSAVIPAALAVAAGQDASQADLLRALAAGYEAMALLGASAGGMDTVHRGFHPTSVFGAFGAATACTCLHAWDRGEVVTPDRLISAWGHALSQASGSMQFSVEPVGGEVKRVHAGLGARNGVLAAEFALLPAVTAPRHVVEGPYGLAASFGGALRSVAPADRLQVHNISLKPYACCRLFHSTIDALREVTQGFSVPPQRIATITISGPQLIADQHMLRRPEGSMAAQYSAPFIVGATLAHGPRRYDAYSDEHLRDPAILEIADKVQFELSEELTRLYYPNRFATGVCIRFTDGSERKAVVVDSAGTPRRPLSKEQVLAKGDGLGTGEWASIGARLQACLWDASQGARSLAHRLARPAA
ncbi:MmgE/PrpD family protein [Azohydromonas australica]|uniref:MmgE/PrpD family protein n=1 Tax=Azohydromonas australica TaxID=364039 RepID=UPI001EE487A7|nr:MmgE/PrpD family protein [Azohydromonas australica]